MIRSQSIDRIFLILFTGLFLLGSCESPVDLDFVLEEPKIVVNSNFSPGAPFQVIISQSSYVLSSEPETFVNNALVTIYNMQEEKEERLQLKNARTPFYQSRQLLPESGQTYKIEVDIPGHPIITAEDVVPFPVVLSEIEVDTTLIPGHVEDQIYKLAVNVQFEDPPGNSDYYHLCLYNHTGSLPGGMVPMDGFTESETDVATLVPLRHLESHKDNPAVTFHFEEGGILFSDEDFNGQSASLTFFSLLNVDSGDQLQKGKVVGELKTVSKSYYQYHSSLSRQLANKDKPFVEPITIYSNIENGLGTFSGFAVFRDSASLSTQ